MPKLVKVDELIPQRHGGGTTVSVIDPWVGAKQLHIGCVVYPPKTQHAQPHSHKAPEEVVVFNLKGTQKAIVEGKEYILGPNMAIFIAPGETHSWFNIGDTDSVSLHIHAPQGPTLHTTCPKCQYVFRVERMKDGMMSPVAVDEVGSINATCPKCKHAFVVQK